MKKCCGSCKCGAKKSATVKKVNAKKATKKAVAKKSVRRAVKASARPQFLINACGSSVGDVTKTPDGATIKCVKAGRPRLFTISGKVAGKKVNKRNVTWTKVLETFGC